MGRSIRRTSRHAAWCRSLVAIVAGLWAAAAPCGAKDLVDPIWIPGINAGFEVFDSRMDYSVENLVNGPFLTTSGDSSIREFLFTIGGELAGPALTPIPGRPRLVVGGGIGIPVASPEALIDVGDSNNPANPEQDIDAYINRLRVPILRRCFERDPVNCPVPVVQPTATDRGFRGQGTDLRASLDNITWQGDLGIRFEVPFLSEMMLQIQPGVTYRGERVKFEGRLTTVTLDELIFANPPTTDFTIHRSRPPAKNEVAHHIGPRLELALVLSKAARPIRTTFFAHASYLWILSERTTQLMDVSGVARYTARRRGANLRGGVGVRLSWIGK